MKALAEQVATEGMKAKEHEFLGRQLSAGAFSEPPRYLLGSQDQPLSLQSSSG